MEPDDLMEELLDRNEALAMRCGVAEFKATNLDLVREDDGRSLRAKDAEIGELKRLYDSARKELQAVRVDGDRTYTILKSLYEAATMSPPKKGRFVKTIKDQVAAIFNAALRDAKKRIDEEIPF